MSTKRVTLELTMDRLNLEALPNVIRKNGKHMLSVSLVWPRPMIAERTALKSIELTDRIEDWSRRPWTDRVVFKEKVEGPFGIRVGLSESMTDAQWRKVLMELGSMVFKWAGAHADDGIAGAVASGLAPLPFKLAGKVLANQAKVDTRWIGAGLFDVETMPPGRSWAVQAPLHTLEPVTRVRRRRERGRMKSTRQTLAPAQALLGDIQLKARVFV